MPVRPTFHLTRPSTSPSPSQLEYVPLASVEDDYHGAAAFKANRYRDRTDLRERQWRPYAGGAALVLLVYLFSAWLWSDPASWDTEYSSGWFGSRAVSQSHIVVTDSARRYIGIKEGSILSWRGIRYARPPLGDLRFRNAMPVEGAHVGEGEEWETVNATAYDEGCPRLNRQGDGFTGKEDCLSLNIHAPAKRITDKLLPVLVWIHGGGYAGGAPHEERYDPTDLVERSISMNEPMLFVSLGYRLGALGFLSDPPEPAGGSTPPHIPTKPPKNLDLNVGFKDQLLALKWIQEEIEAWGGDRYKCWGDVGEPASTLLAVLPVPIRHVSHSTVQVLIIDKLARKLSAVLLSGAATSFPVPFPHDAAARTIHFLPTPTSCPAPVQVVGRPPDNTALIACLRQLPLADLMGANMEQYHRSGENGYWTWLPVLEGDFHGSWLDVRPSDKLVRGAYNRVPVLTGATKDEGTRFTSEKVQSEGDMLQGLKEAFDFTWGDVQKILTPLLEYYPDNLSLGSPYLTGNKTFGLSSSWKRFASLNGDLFFQAPRRHFLRETPKDFGEPSWNYYYDEPRDGAEEAYGSQHAADLASWFGHPEGDNSDERHLSRHMTAYLINFVANMDPNGPGLGEWPQYGMDRRTLHLHRRKITLTNDDDRLEAIRFLNQQNPLFAR